MTPSGEVQARKNGRRFHRWAAILGCVLLSYLAVLTLGQGFDHIEMLLALAGATLLFLALGGVSISIVYPPPRDAALGMVRPYSLFVALEVFSFVLAALLVVYLSQLLPGPVAWVLLLIWLGLQGRLLHQASTDAVDRPEDAWIPFLGTMVGQLAWLTFLILCYFSLPQEQTQALQWRVLTLALVLSPAISSLAFIIATTYARGDVSLVTWARASTAHMITIPTLFALGLLLGISF